MATISSMYIKKWLEDEETNLHLPILKNLCTGLSHVTEMGTRTVTSTWALLAAKPNKVVSIDWNRPPFAVPEEALEEVRHISEQNGIVFEFVQANSTNVEIEETDLLFIDTWHTYEQLILELFLHSDKVKKYIVAHDTNENCFPGMSCAIEDFLNLNPQWKLEYYQDKFPGLTVLQRIADNTVSWGEFKANELQAEINLQHDLYFEECTLNDGPMGIGWHKYTQLAAIKFANQERWPKANQKREVLVINFGNLLTGMVSRGNHL